MSRSWVAGALLGLLTNAAAADDIVYTGTLSMPVIADEIGYPRGVTADLATGEVFVCDTRHNRILIFDEDGLWDHEIPGGEVFSAPRDVAVDPAGYLLVVANRGGRSALLELDFDGLFLREITLAGLPDASPPDFASVALSPDGERVYVLDSVHLQVWQADREGRSLGAIDLAAGLTEKERHDVILGHVDVYGDTVLVPIASVGEIRSFDLDGRQERRTGVHGTAPCTIAFPMAAALDAEGRLLIVDQQRMLILLWDPRANRCLGEYYGLGADPGYFYYPMDLALDRQGRVYVSQAFEGRVQVYDGAKPAAPLAPP